MWLLREQVWIYLTLRKPFPTRVSFFPIWCSHKIWYGWLPGSRVVCFTVSNLLTGITSHVHSYTGSNFCYICWLSWGTKMIMTATRTLLTSPRVVSDGCVILESSTGNIPWSCEQVFPLDTQSLTPCIGSLKKMHVLRFQNSAVNHNRSPGGNLTSGRGSWIILASPTVLSINSIPKIWLSSVMTNIKGYGLVTIVSTVLTDGGGLGHIYTLNSSCDHRFRRVQYSDRRTFILISWHGSIV